MMNLNELAERIAQREGKNKQVNIAQIKEILKIVMEEIGKMPVEELVALVKTSITYGKNKN